MLFIKDLIVMDWKSWAVSSAGNSGPSTSALTVSRAPRLTLPALGSCDVGSVSPGREVACWSAEFSQSMHSDYCSIALSRIILKISYRNLFPFSFSGLWKERVFEGKLCQFTDVSSLPKPPEYVSSGTTECLFFPLLYLSKGKMGVFAPHQANYKDSHLLGHPVGTS